MRVKKTYVTGQILRFEEISGKHYPVFCFKTKEGENIVRRNVALDFDIKELSIEELKPNEYKSFLNRGLPIGNVPIKYNNENPYDFEVLWKSFNGFSMSSYRTTGAHGENSNKQVFSTSYTNKTTYPNMDQEKVTKIFTAVFVGIIMSSIFTPLIGLPVGYIVYKKASNKTSLGKIVITTFLIGIGISILLSIIGVLFQLFFYINS